MIRNGFDLWARVLTVNENPPKRYKGLQETLLMTQRMAAQAVMVNLTPILDAYMASADYDESGHGTWKEGVHGWLWDHREYQPFYVTLFWWRQQIHIVNPGTGSLRPEWGVCGGLSLEGATLNPILFAWPDCHTDMLMNGLSGMDSEDTWFQMSMIAFGRATLACTNVRRIDDPSAARWMKRVDKKLYPMVEWKTVEVPRERVVRPKGDHEPAERASPRLHPVRRHYVRLPNGETIQRGPFWRGNPVKGVVLHDYIAQPPSAA